MKTPTTVDFPLCDEWVFLRPPGHHPDAFDFVGLRDHKKAYFPGLRSRTFFGGVPASAFYGWSRPVLAPIDGVVARSSDGWPDQRSVHALKTVAIWFQATFLFRPEVRGSEIDIRPNVGNYVMIRSKAGQVAFLAHLRAASIRVSPGQSVAAGQPIGEVGNSGNTTAPHLHFNLFDQVDDLLRAKVVPCAFRRYERWSGGAWDTVQGALPQKGEIVRGPPLPPGSQPR